MRKKYRMQHSSMTSIVWTKEQRQSEPVIGNKNSDNSNAAKTKRMWCEYMIECMQQRLLDIQYHMNEAKQNKDVMQWRWQDPKYHTDEAKQNKEAKQQTRYEASYYIDEAKWN